MAEKERNKGIFASLENAIADSILTPQGSISQVVAGAMTAEQIKRKKDEEELLARARAKKEAENAPTLPDKPGMDPTVFTDGKFDPSKASFAQTIMHALLGG